MLHKILTLIDDIGRYSAYLSALLVVSVALLILTEVFCRNVLNISLSFSFEYSAYLMAIAVFGASAFTMRTGGHVRVSLLSTSVPQSLSKYVEIVVSVMGTVIAFVLAYSLVNFAWSSAISGRTSGTIDDTPLAIPQSAMAFGACLLALQMIARTIRILINEASEDTDARSDFSVE
ncbi:MAG: TRAP transporter small permease [Rhizobiaceae bacterium]